MIQLTRLNNQLLVVNSDLIKFIERAPDTVLTLVTGEKVVVRESVDVVLEKVAEFRRRVFGRTEPEITDQLQRPETSSDSNRGAR